MFLSGSPKGRKTATHDVHSEREVSVNLSIEKAVIHSGIQSEISGRGQSSSSPLFGLFALFPFLILTAVLSMYDPQGVSWSLPWVPSLGLALSFRLDGLSFLFACLISGIGTMVQVYALAYLREHKQRLAFHCYLTAFMVAMLGVVLSDNVLLLFVFWELTTVTSYLLIGFNHEALKSRKNALQSLLITGAGGLALLAGLIMLGTMAGSYELTSILAKATEISNHALFLPSLVLILLGALTKSAQFPFHFWLPNAMAAPTPVSAYLHSATMVKAVSTCWQWYRYILSLRSLVLYADDTWWIYCLVVCADGVKANRFETHAGLQHDRRTWKVDLFAWHWK